MTRTDLRFVLAGTPEQAAPTLDHLSSEGARKAARVWIGKEATSLRKTECIERVIRAWRDPTRAAEIVAALKPDERAVLAVVRRFGGYISGGLLQRELLARRIVKASKREVVGYYQREADPVHDLCERLVLVRGAGYHDSYSYGLTREYPNVSLPSQMAAVVEPAGSLGWNASAPVEKAPESTILRAPAQMMVELEQATSALQAQGRWKVNQGGALPAADRTRLGKRLSLQANDSLEPPDRVVLHYALLCALGVVEFDGADGWLEPERAERLFHLPHERQASEWIRAWMGLRIWQDGIGAVPDRDNQEGSTRIEPGVMHKARELLVWALTRVAHSRSDWLDLETFLLDLHAANGEHRLPLYWHRYAWQPHFAIAAEKDKLPAGVERMRAFWMDAAGTWAANALLSTFVHLGVVERGRSGGARSERWSFRLTDVGQAVFGAPEVQIQKASGSEKCLTIQPNHEILLYLDAADGPAVTTLGRIASRASTTGIVQSFTLTRDSVYRALEGGLTPAAIESFLTARSRSGLPANVSHSLTEWSRKRDALVVRSGVSVEANLPDAHEALRGRAVGTRFVVASARTAAQGAKELSVAAESETPVHDWRVDEHGAVFPGEPMSLIGLARLRRVASFSGGSWRITPESIRAARGLGVPADQVLAWLGAHAGDEVPPVLAAAIRNWAGGRGNVFMGNVVLVQVNDPKAFDALQRSERLRPLLQGTLAPGYFIVAPDRRKEVTRLLGELGFALDAPCRLESEVPLATPPAAGPTRTITLRLRKPVRRRFAVIDDGHE